MKFHTTCFGRLFGAQSHTGLYERTTPRWQLQQPKISDIERPFRQARCSNLITYRLRLFIGEMDLIAIANIPIGHHHIQGLTNL